MKEYWPAGHPPPKIIAKIESTGAAPKYTSILVEVVICRRPCGIWSNPHLHLTNRRRGMCVCDVAEGLKNFEEILKVTDGIMVRLTSTFHFQTRMPSGLENQNSAMCLPVQYAEIRA